MLSFSSVPQYFLVVRKKYHVTQRPDDSWAGKAQGGQRASTVGDTEAEVVKCTIEIAKNKPSSQVIIHKRKSDKLYKELDS